jgi:hypothetical protein
MSKNKLLSFTTNFKSRKFLQVCGSIQINATSEKIWQTLSAPNHLLLFNCYIKEHHCDQVTKNHTDQCIYYNDKVLLREMDSYVFQKKLKYKVWFEKENNPTFTCFETIKNSTKASSTFRLTLETNAYKKVPRPIWHIIAYFFIIPSLKKYISAVLLGMKQYCELGQPVEKNQFGKHRSFS